MMDQNSILQRLDVDQDLLSQLTFMRPQLHKDKGYVSIKILSDTGNVLNNVINRLERQLEMFNKCK